MLENLNVSGLVKNHNLALSINDASWSIFREWLEYFGAVFNKEIIAVDPKFTSQDCSNCGNRIKKSLTKCERTLSPREAGRSSSCTRTHQCNCGAVLCRDHNAAINILNKGTGGQPGNLSVGVSFRTPIYRVNASGQMTLWLDQGLTPGETPGACTPRLETSVAKVAG